ncbi:(Fe-S)-binding protein [Oleidesulfovibrio sp.]|uniref:(Fe-S)-binding protein n=1 Tax=Oleidesulfovibrio sp. TaxID=2909707 RepID=UPI003A8AADB2
MNANTPAKDCILCGRCLDVCPIFLASGKEELSPKAKHQLFKALKHSPDRLKELPARKLADLCVSCGRCEKACPQGLSVPQVLGTVRAQHPAWHQWMWQRWITKGNILWPAVASLGGLAPKGLLPQNMRPMLTKMEAMRDSAPEPWFRIAEYPDSMQRRPVMLFSGCTARRIRHRWSASAAELLTKAGLPPVAEADFTCCGCTLEHAGIPQAAATARKHNVEVWKKAGKPLLVTFCATCNHGLQAYTADASLWEENNTTHPPATCGKNQQHPSAQEWTESIIPLSKLLAGCILQPTQNAPDGFRYHQPCHAPRSNDPDISLLKVAVLNTPETTLHGITTRQCCGMGGVMQLAAPSLCGTVNDACWAALNCLQPAESHSENSTYSSASSSDNMAEIPTSGLPESQPERAQQERDVNNRQNHTPSPVLTGCSGCTLQLAGTAPDGVRVHHWLDIIKP